MTEYSLASLPFVDSERMGVAGGSYGGYMTDWIVGHTDRFRSAITDRSVVNLVSMAGTSNFPMIPDRYWQSNWWDSPEKLWKCSPIAHAGRIRTPLMIMHSEGDLRCPISEADQLLSALKRLGARCCMCATRRRAVMGCRGEDRRICAGIA